MLIPVYWITSCFIIYANNSVDLISVSAFHGPENIGTHLESQVYGSDTELHTRTDFTLRSFQPKVQIPFQVAPGQRPRKLEIER